MYFNSATQKELIISSAFLYYLNSLKKRIKDIKKFVPVSATRKAPKKIKAQGNEFVRIFFFKIKKINSTRLTNRQ